MMPRHELSAALASPDEPVLESDLLRLIAELNEPEDCDSIPHIRGLKRSDGERARLRGILCALPATDTQTLISQLETTKDALALWGAHLQLNRRGVPPALRWPANTSTSQAEFITALADLLWLTTRHPKHTPAFKDWRQLFKLAPNSDEWHGTALSILSAIERRNFASNTSKGLALTDTQRQELMTCPTPSMLSERRQLQPEQFAEIRQRLCEHALGHPDLSRLRTPESIAERRAKLWRVAILTGNSPARIRENWELLTGEARKRQVLSRHLAAVQKTIRGGGGGRWEKQAARHALYRENTPALTIERNP